MRKRRYEPNNQNNKETVFAKFVEVHINETRGDLNKLIKKG